MEDDKLKFKWVCSWYVRDPCYCYRVPDNCPSTVKNYDGRNESASGDLELTCFAESKLTFKTPKAAALAGIKHDKLHLAPNQPLPMYDKILMERKYWTYVIGFKKGEKRYFGFCQDLIDYNNFNKE